MLYEVITHRVIGAIDLDNGKLARVVAQPRFRALDAARIEQAGRYQRLVSPRCGADKDLIHEPFL